MNDLSNQPSQQQSTSTDNQSPPVTHPSSTPSLEPMTIRMAFPASNKGGPLDLSPADRILGTSECPTLLKPCDMLTSSENDLPPNLHDEKPSTSASVNAHKMPGATPKAPDSTATSDDVSNQLKTLAEIFKALVSTPNGTPDAAASLLEMIVKKAANTEANGTSNDPPNAPGSLEALHQLGWQLISLGRGGSNNSAPVSNTTSTSTTGSSQSAAAPTWMPSRPSCNRPSVPTSQLNPSIHAPPPPPISGISMRGNQKYSAFYQHNRKQVDVGESIHHPSASQLQRLGFPTQPPPNRRLNGPPMGSHPRPYFANPPEAAMTKAASIGRMVPDISAPTPTRSRETAFLCSCGQDFDSLYIFTLHMKDTGHKPRSSQPERDIPKLVRGQDMWINSETEQTREILRCMRCNQSFRSLPELTMHMMKTSHYSEIVYSDAGRNLLASQTISSVVDRSRSGLANKWTGGIKSAKRSVRTTGHTQNGAPAALMDLPRSMEPGKVNGLPLEPLSTDLYLKQEEPSGGSLAKCERPASSHELHVVKPSPKPAASPDAVSCPSELQRSAASSPRNGVDRHEHKYLNSPSSSRGNASPRRGCSTTEDKSCSDSVIRQIEYFVEKSLPFPSFGVSNRPSWQGRLSSQSLTKCGFPRPNISPLAEPETSRSTPEKSSQRKRRFSSGSSASAAQAPATSSPTETSASMMEKRSLLSFSSNHTTEDSAAENPLSSLQKLVETTHQASGTNGCGPCPAKSPVRQIGDISTVPFSTSSDVEMPNHASSSHLPRSSTPSSTSSQSNMAAALLALQKFMSKISNTNPHRTTTTSTTKTTQDAPKNGESDAVMPANWTELLTTMINAAKQSDDDPKRPDTAPDSLPSSPKSLSNPSAIFGQFPSMFAAFDMTGGNRPMSLPVHMSTGQMGSSGLVANITKKAKCHFCGKPFANKGQVRLHISKNKCPCLLQQSAAAAMIKPLLTPSSAGATMASQGGDKRPMGFPYGGFHPHANPGPLGVHDLACLFGGQQAPADHKAAEAALLRHFSLPQPNRPANISPPPQPPAPKPIDLIANLARAASENNSSSSSSAAAGNPLLSLLFPSTQPPPPPPQPTVPSGLSAEQKALFLFAQAMASIAGATSLNKPPEVTPHPTPVNPLANLLQSFNFPTSNPVPVTNDGPSTMTPELMSTYMNAIRQIAAMGAVPAASQASMTTANPASEATDSLAHNS